MENLIRQIIESGKDVSINVRASELKEFGLDILKEFNNQIQKPQDETYLTTKQASELLQVDRSTLWRWNQEHYLMPVKVGTKSLYKQSDIDKILKR